MVGELRLAQYAEFKPRISPLRWTRPRPSMVLFRPLAHAILHDARGAFHTKQRFIQTVTTGNIIPKAECQELGELHTTARLEMPLVRIGAVHEGVDRGGTAQVLSHTHLNPRGRGVPPERKSDRLSWVNHRERLPLLVREKRWF